MSIKLKGKHGFYPVDKEGVYYRLFDNGKTRPTTCQIKGMIDPLTHEIVIYSERDQEFLIINGDKSVMISLGKVLKRGLLISEIIAEGIKRKILHNRIKFRQLPWDDVSVYTNEHRFYHYLRNA